jgi:hypothetical protein
VAGSARPGGEEGDAHGGILPVNSWTMRLRARWLTVGSALPTVVLLADGCRSATEVKLDIATNVVCADMRGVDIVVAADPHAAESRAALAGDGTTRRFPSASTSECHEGTPPRAIGSLVVTPSAGEGAVVVIAAFGTARLDDCKAPSFAATCIVARRRFTFIDHTAPEMTILLDPDCAGVPCNESSTCVGKKCVDSTVDCSSGTCGAPGISPDGGTIVVDGASPLDVVPPPPPGDGAPPPPPPDDAAVDALPDAPPDAPVDAVAADGGAVTCGTYLCADTVTCDSDPVCCYPPSGAMGTCTQVNACANGLAVCCNDQRDCNMAAGERCCASTPTFGPGTVISCVAPGQTCYEVCHVFGLAGQCNGGNCTGTAYTPPPYPEFYGCS